MSIAFKRAVRPSFTSDGSHPQVRKPRAFRPILIRLEQTMRQHAFVTAVAGETSLYMQGESIRVEKLVPLLTVGEAAANGYTFVGVPGGLGAYATGAFVSDWMIDFQPTADGIFSFSAISGQDAFDAAFDWDGTNYVQLANQFQAFCSAYLAGPQYDRVDPSQVYFVTTGAGTTPDNLDGRGYRVTFNDLADALAGGTFEVIIDGSEGIVSPDNICMDSTGTLLLQEDPNHNLATIGLARDASIWAYDTKTSALSRVTSFDTALVASIDPAYFPGMWESSCIISMEEILGPGSRLFDVQAHYNLPSPLVQGGQVLAIRIGEPPRRVLVT